MVIKISGRQTLSVLRRYAIVTEEDLREAAVKLDRHLKKTKSETDKKRTILLEATDEVLLIY